MIRDCKLVAQSYKISFKFNSYFPIKTLNLMRGVMIAEEDGIDRNYIDCIFRSIWCDGLNMNDDMVIEKVLKNFNINPKTFFLRSTTQIAKEKLKNKTEEAYKKGIFGAPTFYTNK